MPSVLSCLNTSSSMKFFGGGKSFTDRAQRHAGAEHGDLPLIAGHHRHVPDRSRVFTSPLGVTSAISVSFGSNCVIAVTSSVEPSV